MGRQISMKTRSELIQIIRERYLQSEKEEKTKIIDEFDDKVDIEVDDELPIVISGGTSLPEGFIDLFKNVISNYELPFELSEIRSAKNPMTAVANGLLIRTIADVKGK